MADSAGNGIQIIAICHGLAQLEGRWDTHGAQAIWDTAGIKVILGGVTDASTLEELSRLCGEIDLRTPSRTIDDYGRRARTWTYQPARVLPPELLRTLPDWRALVVRGNLSPVVVRLRMAWRRHDHRDARRTAQPAAVAFQAAQPLGPSSPWPADMDDLIALPAGHEPWHHDPAGAPPFSPDEVRAGDADWPHLPAGWSGAEHARHLSADDQESANRPRRPWQRPGNNGERQ